MDKLVKEYLKNKISKITNQSFNGNLNQFYSTNKTFSIFVQNYNLATVLKRMNFTISEEDYINTLNELVSIKAYDDVLVRYGLLKLKNVLFVLIISSQCFLLYNENFSNSINYMMVFII